MSVRVSAVPLPSHPRLAPERVAGIIAAVLGLGAFWIALPPIEARSPLPSILIGAAAAALGLGLFVSGERRLGLAALAAAAVGIAGGVLATHSSVGHLESTVVWSALIAATLRFAAPLTFAALGGLFSERSGVVNIALEGMMLMGAFFGIWAADWSGTWIVGLLVAALAGAALALVHAFFSIHLRADQIVIGTGLNILALGVTGYFFVQHYGSEGTPSSVSGIPDVNLHLGGFVGAAVGQLNLMIWLMFGLLVVTYVVMFRTPFGLRMRSVGEHPRAADTVGIPVYKMRYAGVVISGVLAALGGAYLSIGFVHSFNEGMTKGRGFIALAALIFGKWRPFGAFAAALLFGFSSAVADRMQTYNESLPGVSVLIQSLPYVLTIIAVAGVIGRSIPPAAVGRPYAK